MSEPADDAPQDSRKKKGGLEELGGLLIPLLVLSLIFGEEAGGFVFVAAVGVVAALTMLDARFRTQLVAAAQRRAWETQQRFLKSCTGEDTGLLPSERQKP